MVTKRTKSGSFAAALQDAARQFSILSQNSSHAEITIANEYPRLNFGKASE
jgi:hypothetical protein